MAEIGWRWDRRKEGRGGDEEQKIKDEMGWRRQWVGCGLVAIGGGGGVRWVQYDSDDVKVCNGGKAKQCVANDVQVPMIGKVIDA
ncbi:hypothetical protein U1Q18_003710 [Sarracenia purpurea var. burkii]